MTTLPHSAIFAGRALQTDLLSLSVFAKVAEVTINLSEFLLLMICSGSQEEGNSLEKFSNLSDLLVKFNAIFILCSFKLSNFSNFRASSYPLVYISHKDSHSSFLHPLYSPQFQWITQKVPHITRWLNIGSHLPFIGCHLR